MDKNETYNPPSSSRPDIDENWQKMILLLDKEKPVAGKSHNTRRWVLTILLILLSDLATWYRPVNNNIQNNSDNISLKNHTIQNKVSKNTVGIKDGSKNIFSKDSSLNTKIKNINLLNNIVNPDIKKSNIADDLKVPSNILLAKNNSPLSKQKKIASLDQHHKKNNISSNPFNHTPASSSKKNGNITQQIFKDRLPRMNAEKLNIDISTGLANTQNENAKKDQLEPKKDTVGQNNIIADSAKKPKEMAIKNHEMNDSAKQKTDSISTITSKTGEKKKKNKTFNSHPSLRIGLSPSFSFQRSGYAKSSGLNYLAAADIFVSLVIPLSKHFALQAGLHPYAGMPLRSGKWERSLENLDQTHVLVSPHHTITTLTSYKISGLSSLSLPITLNYIIAHKFNISAGLQVSTFFYGGSVKHTFTNDSSAAGIHTSSISESNNIFKGSTANVIKKTSLSSVLGIDYSLHRFTFGLQYIRGFSDITSNSFLHSNDKNTIKDFRLFLMFDLSKGKK